MDFTQILNLIKKNTNTQNNTTSSYPIADKTVDVNNALNRFFILANSAVGNWKPADDTNQTDYPIIYGDIEEDVQDYAFVTDENGNQILDIYRVRIKDPITGKWQTLNQMDQNEMTDSDLDTDSSGMPTDYYLNSNGIFLVQKPNFTLEEGLEVWVNRTSTYFTVLDTTKKAGIPWVFAEYLALRPSYFYCSQKGLKNKNDLKEELYGKDGNGGMERDIKKFYRDRNRSHQDRMTSEDICAV